MKSVYFIVITAIMLVYGCEKEPSAEIKYPEEGIYGDNILELNNEQYSGQEFSLAAELLNGAELEVVITALDNGIWAYRVGSSVNWAITTFDDQTKTQTFQAANTNLKCDLKILFDSGSFKIEYFEMDNTEPTHTKIISVN